MKFIRYVICFLVVLLYFLIATISSSAKQAIINTDHLNVRNGPGLKYSTIRQLYTDEIYPIIKIENGWTKIQLDHKTGWIKSEFISVTEETGEDSQPSDEKGMDKKSIVIPEDNTHLRKGPSSKYEIIHFVTKGTEFEVVDVEGEWYKISNGDLSGYILSKFVDNEANPISNGLNNKTIVIDAGHGGQDVGAIGTSGAYEKDITYKTAEEIKNELSLLGAEVILTRKADDYITLASRASLSNLPDTDAFISIHYNSAPDLPNANGIGSYYYHEKHKDLAELIQQELIQEGNAKNRGFAYGDYQVLRQNLHPSVLVELGFISNKEKEQLLLTSAYQKKLVSGIVNGLEKYFSH